MIMKSMKVLLQFAVNEAEKPICWVFATKFNLHFSILQADCSAERGGILIMNLSGEEKDLKEAIEYARTENVDIKVLSESIKRDPEKCVHCGSCTAVCRTRALTIDPVTAELCFDNALCVVCEKCTRVCPTGAMKVALFE